MQSPVAEFARRGFREPSAAAGIWQSWSLGDDAPLDLSVFEPVGDRFCALQTLDQLRARDPERFALLCEDPGWCGRVLRVAGASSVLAQFLGRRPELVDGLRRPPEPRDARQWREFFDRWTPVVDGVCTVDSDQLRIANRAALVEIAARDLAAEDPADVVESVSLELSHVADNVLRVALALAHAEVPDWRDARLAVIAFGKTGAQELNYLSDVDVMYVAEPAEGVGNDKAMAVATRLAAGLARICSAHTRAGTIWTVDAGLRPEGNAGPLVRTLASLRTYYGRWAKNWEFQALLKGRPAAGDLELGQEFVDMVQPWVWEAGHRDGFLPELRAMRERVISLIPPAQEEREIKLSSGGLRDTEFTVQLLQLVHGRADDRIRSRGTLAALRELVEFGYIGRSDGAQMAEHYRFQRLLEHRMQLKHLRRTHLVTEDPEELGEIARTMGFGPEEVESRWRASRRDIRRLRQRIFFSPLLDVFATVPTESLLTPDAAMARIRALGFDDPRSALGHIEALTTGTSRAVEIQRQLMPAMLEWFADGPNPDFGLLSFRQLSEALGDSSWYLRALRDEGYMAQRFAKVASTSRYVVDLLKRAPQSVRWLASTDQLRLPEGPELADALKKAAARHDDVDRAIGSARAMRRSELCRVAIADVLGELGIDDCGRALADIGSATVEAALEVARRDIDAPPVGVVALGRWGGRELSYASDADCMFVVPDGTEGEALAAAGRLVRRLAEILAKPGPDPAFPLDTKLRPEGADGPPVRTVASYAAYYAKWASTWERQMLLRARYGGGDEALVAAVLADVGPYRYPEGGLTPAQLTEIRRLKSRMENERLPKGGAGVRHLKLGPGGLSDVEWTVQVIQLQHAHEHPGLRVTGTMEALDAALDLGLVAQEDADALAAAWRHASSLRDAIMLVRGRPSDVLPSDLRELAAISALLGIPGPVTQLGERTRRLARRASAVVARLFWGE